MEELPFPFPSQLKKWLSSLHGGCLFSQRYDRPDSITAAQWDLVKLSLLSSVALQCLQTSPNMSCFQHVNEEGCLIKVGCISLNLCHVFLIIYLHI